MEVTAILLIILGVAAVVGFFVLKRMVKWAVRLALLFVALALIIAGAVAWAWMSWTSDETPARNGKTNTRPAGRAR